MTEKYTPQEIEDKWYAYWLANKCFHSEPDGREPFCMVIPPPNVTGILHMGHMLNNTIQDVLARRARLQGKNVCWVPGTDHASIATEAKVVALLKSKGIEKRDLSREEFLKHAMEWKDKHGGIILEQLKKLGASCDWDRTNFTMDTHYYESVIEVFCDLYEKGLIYRDVRMVNWDPQAQTSLSDEEVVFKEIHGKLFYLKYIVEGGSANGVAGKDYLLVATTRPETIMGDIAVCVHPDDERYKHLTGKKVIVPLVGRAVPVIADEYVDKEFGTGALKITPAHDINDYRIGMKYNLPVIDIFNDNGTVSEQSALYIGMDRFDVRKQIVKDLAVADLLEKEEDYTNNVGFSERTDAVIEPKLSMQWFLKMKDIARPALEAVENDTIKFHPAKFKNMYRHWMENVKDWCVSRQLWWGQRIPAYYLPDGSCIVGRTLDEALERAHSKFPDLRAEDLKQDEDVLDTWFSSWLWPIAVFDGIRHPDNKDVNYYYPTNDLVTAPEIIFFWVARMIIAGLLYRNEIPFKNVYFTGIVRDKQGRKMSKQLGNSPDPIDLINKYGADGVRVGLLLTSPAGNDLPFDESICEQGRNFSNKIWNALKLVKGWNIDNSATQRIEAGIAAKWFAAKLRKETEAIEEHFAKYRLNDALMSVYKLIWDDFCSWYLEMIKPAYGSPIDGTTYRQVCGFFETLMKILHPFMPFLTEEIWHETGEACVSGSSKSNRDGKTIMTQILQTEKVSEEDEKLLLRFENAMEVIMAIRAMRNEKNIPQKTPVSISIREYDGDNADNNLSEFYPLIKKLCNLETLENTGKSPDETIPFRAGKTELFLHSDGAVNKEETLAKAKKDLIYNEGFLAAVTKKLSNEKFVQNAPIAVLEIERKKQADAEGKIAMLKAQIASLSA
ncbi:MAG: valine--tRNA ligase [Bacteroidales bacterium]|jgi:valyl-tRNA synthetase|nr:valine--tRNA ligase [Bacteroidales bacterium]